MKMKKAIMATIVLPVIFGSTMAMAKPHHHGFGDKCGGERGLMSQLDLTDAQKTQVKALHEKQREEMKEGFQAHHDAVKANKDKIDAIVFGDKFDEAATKKILQDMANDRLNGELQRTKSRYEMMQILTPEQKETYQKLRQERHEKCMEEWKEKKEARDSKEK